MCRRIPVNSDYANSIPADPYIPKWQIQSFSKSPKSWLSSSGQLFLPRCWGEAVLTPGAHFYMSCILGIARKCQGFAVFLKKYFLASYLLLLFCNCCLYNRKTSAFLLYSCLFLNKLCKWTLPSLPCASSLFWFGGREESVFCRGHIQPRLLFDTNFQK